MEIPSQPPPWRRLPPISSPKARVFGIIGNQVVITLSDQIVTAIGSSFSWASVSSSCFFRATFISPETSSFQLTSVSVSNFSASASADLTVRFKIRNPNKNINLTYVGIQSYVIYKDYYLASGTHIPPFQQTGKNFTSVSADFSVNVDPNLANHMHLDMARHGVARFTLRVKGKMLSTYPLPAWKRQGLSVLCKSVPVAMSDNNGESGNLIGGPRECGDYATK